MVCMPSVKISMSNLINFLQEVCDGVYKKKALLEIESALKRALLNNIWVSSYSNVYSIYSANEMRSLIRSGSSPQKGTYNAGYRYWKQARGLPPHVLTGETKNSTHIDIIGDTLLFYIPQTATTRTRVSRSIDIHGNVHETVHVYNFGPIHEKRKSILKAATVFAWRDIRKRLVDVYFDGLIANGGI